MFDTPDLSPLCAAPFVAIFATWVLYNIALQIIKVVQKKTGTQKEWVKEVLLILSLGLLLPTMCISSIALEIGASDPAPWNKPTTSNIVGKWEYSSETIKSFEYYFTVPSHELVFNEDGTFYINNLPSFWIETIEYSETEKVETITGTGTWYLSQIEGYQRMEWIIFTQFQTINGKNDDHQMRFHFQGHLPPYTLVTLDTDNFITRFDKKIFEWK